MPKEKSAGAIIARKERGEPLYLLLHYPSTRRSKKEYWDFAKGHGNLGETEEQTIKREVKEETGITDLKFTPGFREIIRYFFQAEGKKIFKTVVFYCAITKTSKVSISFEHVAFKWLPFHKALEQLKFKNAKRLLIKAHNLLEVESVRS